MEIKNLFDLVFEVFKTCGFLEDVRFIVRPNCIDVIPESGSFCHSALNGLLSTGAIVSIAFKDGCVYARLLSKD